MVSDITLPQYVLDTRRFPIETATTDRERLAEELARAMPRLDPEEQRASIALYGLLARGEPVSPERLPDRAGVSAERVARLLDRPGVYLDGQGRVVGFWGMALSGMPHRLKLRGRKVRAWCAWDTLFLPELIGETVSVESPCPTTGETVRLTVTPNGIETVSPEAAVLSFLHPAKTFDADTIVSFCHFVHFFVSEAAAGEWTASRPDTFVLSLDDGFEIGRLTNRAKFGAALGAGGRVGRR